MNELATKFAARAAASAMSTKRYRHIWTQEQGGVTYGDGVSTWPAVYELSTSATSTALTVKVLIGATDGGGGFTAEVATRWSMAIKRVSRRHNSMWRKMTMPSAGSFRTFQTARTGRTPRSLSLKTMHKTGPITSTPIGLLRS